MPTRCFFRQQKTCRRSATALSRLAVQLLEDRLTPADFYIPDGDISAFRAAILSTYTNGQSDNIFLAANGSYVLTQAVGSTETAFPSIRPEFDFSSPSLTNFNVITIYGSGATIRRSTAPGTPLFRFFEVPINLSLYGLVRGDLVLKDLTLSNGAAPFGNQIGGNGGAIDAGGNLTLQNCRLVGNGAGYGGAIDAGGSLTLQNCVFSDNHAYAYFDAGGALYSSGAGAVIENCTFSENGADGSYATGGAMYVAGGVTIRNSIIINNHSSNRGGGISSSGPLTLVNTTITGNRSKNGGGVFSNSAGENRIGSCTITNNTATGEGSGGGLYGWIELAVTNSIIAANWLESGGTGPDISGAIKSLAYCIIGDSSGATLPNGVGNQVGSANSPIDPVLGPLSANGGPTLIYPLLETSPAIDRGDPGFAPPPATDQRGQPRVQNGRIDIGAFEAIPADLRVTKDDGVASVTPGQPTTYVIVVTNAGPADMPLALVQDDLPVTLVNASWTAAATGGATVNASSGTGNIYNTVTLPVNASVTFRLTATVSQSAAGTVANTATVRWLVAGYYDPNPANNGSKDTNSVTPPTPPQADLSITKANSATGITSGQATSYVIVVRNSGPAAVSGARVVDTLPTALIGATWQTTVLGGATAPNSGNGSINVGVDLPVGGNVTFTLTATVSTAATSQLTNTATVAAPNGITDPNTGNNTASVTNAVNPPPTPQADLAVSLDNGVATVAPGSMTTYTLVARNNGPSPVSGAILSFAIPAGVTGITWTSTAQGGATGNVANGSGTISHSLSLSAGSSVTYAITAAVSPSATGTLTTAASIQAPAGVTDPNASNNSIQDIDTIGTPPPGGPIDYPNGFATGTAGVLTFSGGAAMVNGRLRLTDGGADQARSVFSTARQAIARFSTTFAFQLANPDADGFTFTIQGVGPDALGYLGGGLGYGPDYPGGNGASIPKSLAVKFDLYDNAGEGGNSTGVYTKGASPTTPANPLGTTLDLHSGHMMRATITYDGANVKLSLTDMVTTQTFSKTYTGYNIVQLVGGPTAYVGFTAGTGLLTATLEIHSWVFGPLPPNVGSSVYVAATDAGVPAQMSAYNSLTGARLQAFQPYGSFGGGVRVAVADFNGDGVRDFVTAPGPGGGPHVKVIDGATGATLAQFFAYEATFTGGVYVAAGDVTGDGTPDILTGTGVGGGPRVRVYDGRTFTPLPGSRGDFFPYDSAFRGGVYVAAGDVNGDGKADVITGAGIGGGPHVRVYDGVTAGTLIQFFAYEDSFRGGVYVAAGDVDGDGKAEIITGPGDGGGPYARVFRGLTGVPMSGFLAYDAAFRGGLRVAAVDVNSDGIADIITGAGPGGGPHVRSFTSTGTGLTSFFAYDPSFLGGIFVGGA